MSSLFDELAAEAADVSSAPSDEQIAKIREKCVEMSETSSEVSRLERELDDAKKRLNVLAHKELPDLFNTMEIDRFGLPDVGEYGADVVLSPYFKASIPADWPDDLKKIAFDHLEEIGGGDLIRVEVRFSLGKGEGDLARKIATVVSDYFQGSNFTVPAPTIGQGVPWNSLTSFVKERYNLEQSEAFGKLIADAMESGEEPPVTMDTTKLNATIGQVVKIKERKK